MGINSDIPFVLLSHFEATKRTKKASENSRSTRKKPTKIAEAREKKPPKIAEALEKNRRK